jgi:hypothetical protein
VRSNAGSKRLAIAWTPVNHCSENGGFIMNAKIFDLKMKCLVAVGVAVIAFVTVNGIKTKRHNGQLMFALQVEHKIGIDTIKVRAVNDSLVLEGIGSGPQIQYAEKVANAFIEKHSTLISNPPKKVTNRIADKYAARRSKNHANRAVAFNKGG